MQSAFSDHMIANGKIKHWVAIHLRLHLGFIEEAHELFTSNSENGELSYMPNAAFFVSQLTR